MDRRAARSEPMALAPARSATRCPARPGRTARSLQRLHRVGHEVVVTRVDGAKVEDRAVAFRRGRSPASASAARERRGHVSRRARRRRTGSRRPAACRRRSPTRSRRPRPRRPPSARRAEVVDGAVAIRQNGSASPSRSRYAERDLLQRAEHESSGAQGAIQGMACARVDQVGAADEDAGLRSAEQLVAGEDDERGAGGEGLARRGLVAQPRRRAVRQPRAGGVEQARAEVDDDRRADRRRASATAASSVKPGDAVVRLVHLQDQRRRRRRRARSRRGGCGSSCRPRPDAPLTPP